MRLASADDGAPAEEAAEAIATPVTSGHDVPKV